jgi:hypothetical protein
MGGRIEQREGKWQPIHGNLEVIPVKQLSTHHPNQIGTIDVAERRWRSNFLSTTAPEKIVVLRAAVVGTLIPVSV